MIKFALECNEGFYINGKIFNTEGECYNWMKENTEKFFECHAGVTMTKYTYDENYYDLRVEFLADGYSDVRLVPIKESYQSEKKEITNDIGFVNELKNIEKQRRIKCVEHECNERINAINCV